MKYYKPILIAVSGTALGVAANPILGFRYGLALAPGRTAASAPLHARDDSSGTPSSQDNTMHLLEKHERPMLTLHLHRLPVSEIAARDFHEDLATRGSHHEGKQKHGGKHKEHHGGKHKEHHGGKDKKHHDGKHKKEHKNGHHGEKHKEEHHGGKGKRHGQHKKRLAARDFDQDLDARLVLPPGTNPISLPVLHGTPFRILRRLSDLAERDSLDGENDLASRELDYEMDELD